MYKRQVQWSSSNTSVATVTNGVVSGVAAGIATITASCGGLSVSATVKVHNACSSSQPRKILDVSYYQGNIDWAAVKDVYKRQFFVWCPCFYDGAYCPG